MNGDLPAGTLLSEAQVAADLGVSRTPLREAFRALLGDGLLEEGANRQVRVRVMPDRSAEDLNAIVSGLVAMTLPRVAHAASASDLDQLRLVTIGLRRAIRAGDVVALLDAEDDYRLQLARAAQMPMVEEVLRRVLAQARLAGLPHRAPARRIARNFPLDAAADHLENGETTAAERALRRYRFGVGNDPSPAP